MATEKGVRQPARIAAYFLAIFSSFHRRSTRRMGNGGNEHQPIAALCSAALLWGAVSCNTSALNAGWNQAPEGSAQSVPISPNSSQPASLPVDSGPAMVSAPTATAPDASSSGSNRTDAGTALGDAGSSDLDNGLPVSAENPVILVNDGPFDNWQGEYALLFAHAGGPPIAGIVVGVGRTWPDLEANLTGWRDLVAGARDSGLTEVPDPLGSDGTPLARPTDGNADSTVPNGSEGARFIVEKSLELAEPELPVVVATGGALTDVADAYLLDPTVVDRVVVMASLGTGLTDAAPPVARMGIPNGEMDTWADAIVVQKFRYIQVSAFYDQAADVPEERSPELPDNSFGDWIRAKRGDIWPDPIAADQVSAIALALPEFTIGVERVSQVGWADDQPTLAPDVNGNAWIVTASDGAAARARFWDLLSDPATFGR
jgi:hypothetical protein